MNMKQSCKALICAIEGELDGRHCTEEQAAAILDHALPSLTEALARVEAERDNLMDTYVALVEKLGIDLDAARKAPGKPSDVFVSYISGIQAQLAEAVGLLRYSQEIARLFDDEHTAEVGRFLDRHAQAEQQEECAHEFVPFQPACLKCGELYQAEQQEAQDAQLDKAARIALLERELDRERERADMAEVELQHARAALATRSEASQFAAAAAFVRNMATDYANEHGWDDMGGLSFGAGPQGTAKMEHFLFLEELAEKLRTMTTEGGAGHA